MFVRGRRLGELGQEQADRLGRDLGQDESEGLAGGWLGGGEDVGPVEAPVAQAGRALAFQPPAVTQPPFLPDPGFILEKQADMLAGMGRRGVVQGAVQPFFKKRSCAFGSVWG